MNFIKLTDIDGNTIFVNAAQILFIKRDITAHCTDLIQSCDSENCISVIERPEEVLRAIKGEL